MGFSNDSQRRAMFAHMFSGAKTVGRMAVAGKRYAIGRRREDHVHLKGVRKVAAAGLGFGAGAALAVNSIYSGVKSGVTAGNVALNHYLTTGNVLSFGKTVTSKPVMKQLGKGMLRSAGIGLGLGLGVRALAQSQRRANKKRY